MIALAGGNNTSSDTIFTNDRRSTEEIRPALLEIMLHFEATFRERSRPTAYAEFTAKFPLGCARGRRWLASTAAEDRGPRLDPPHRRLVC